MKLFQLERQARRLALPSTPKAVLTCLISYSNVNGDGTQIYPGIATIALECSISERTAQRCVRWLEVEGWIVAIYQKGGAGRPSSYHLNLDQFGWLEARKPPSAEPEEIDPARRLRFAYGVLKRLAADSPARPRWQQEIAALEAQLGEASPAGSSDLVRALPAIPETPAIIHQAQPLSEEDFEQLEIAYFGSVAAQAREPRDSLAWRKWLPLVEPLRDQYNQALYARGIVASDGHDPPMNEELEEQLQDDQRRQWQEEQRLRALIEDRTIKRDLLKPGSTGWRMMNALINQARNTLNNGIFHEQQQGGYVT
jgi:Helix-turn-helix domain